MKLACAPASASPAARLPYREVLTCYAPFVYAVGLRICGNSFDAEDVAYACFARLREKFDEPPSHLADWLHGTAAAYAEERARGQETVDRVHTNGRSASAAESADLWTAVSRRVDGLIRELPDGQRQTLLECLTKTAWSSPSDSRAVAGLCSALHGHGLPVEDDALHAWLTAHFVEEAAPYFLLDRLKGLIPAQAQVAAQRTAPAQKRNAAVSALLTVVIAALAAVALAGFTFVRGQPTEPAHATVPPSRQARETENLHDGVFYGYVSGDTRSPVKGASIVMTERGTGLVSRTVTNARGQFEISGLRRKSVYDVRVLAPGYMERNSVTDALPEEANNYMMILLNAPASVWGTVIDFERKPVSGAKVSLEQPRLTGDYRTYATTTTDANGRYRLDGVRVGRFWLHVTYEGLSVRGDTPIELTSGQVIDNVSIVLPSPTAKGQVSCPDPGTVSVLFVE